jgi:hypothetical protein
MGVLHGELRAPRSVSNVPAVSVSTSTIQCGVLYCRYSGNIYSVNTEVAL